MEAHHRGGAKTMADRVRRVEYYYVTVPDRPGESYRVLAALRDAGISLLAYHTFPIGNGQAQIDLVPADADRFRQGAQAAGLSLVGPRKALFIEGEDRVGAAAEHAGKLAGAGVNIIAATALGAGAGRYGMIIWVSGQDYAKAGAALGACSGDQAIMNSAGREELAVLPLPGWPSDAGRWLWALQDVRRRYTLRLLEGLDQQTLDWEGPDGGENSIGSLLYHIALVEMSWLHYDLLLQTKFPPRIESEFPYPMQTADGRLTRVLGEPLESHLRRLDHSRKVFLDTIRELADAEWRRPRTPAGEGYTVTPEWVVFHLVEHEAGHAFQISALKRRAARWFKKEGSG